MPEDKVAKMPLEHILMQNIGLPFSKEQFKDLLRKNGVSNPISNALAFGKAKRGVYIWSVPEDLKNKFVSADHIMNLLGTEMLKLRKIGKDKYEVAPYRVLGL
jgi:hypothetical protein